MRGQRGWGKIEECLGVSGSSRPVYEGTVMCRNEKMGRAMCYKTVMCWNEKMSRAMCYMLVMCRNEKMGRAMCYIVRFMADHVISSMG